MKTLQNISTSDGHIIENAAGTELEQRSNLKFSGYLTSTDDSTNDATVISDAPTEIDYEDWLELTEQEKEGTHWMILNAPSVIQADSPEIIGIGYGVCSTAAATVAKTATITNFNLTTNGFVAIKFENDVPANATLNINSEGAVPIYYESAAITADIIKGGSVVTLVYDGSVYHLLANGTTQSGTNVVFTPTLTEGTKIGEIEIDGTSTNVFAPTPPVVGTAAALDVATSGDASATQVVKGDDSRLTDARPASDVSAWAKEATKPTYTAAEVGLGNVGNFKAVSTEANQGLSATEQLNARTNIGAGTSDFDGQYSSLSGTPTLGSAAAMNVATTGDAASNQVVKGDDTRLTDARPASDVSAWAKESTKPSYTATEVGAIPTTDKGISNGVATLDSNGKIPTSQLPSAIDEIIEGYLYEGVFYEDSAHTTPITGETSKIYVDLSTNKTYRYSGSQYVEISASLALGETSSTAYRGDYGKAAYDHSLVVTGNPHNVTKSDVGLGNVGNFKAVSTEENQGLSNTEKLNARTNIGAGTSNFDGQYSSLSGLPTLGTAAELNVAVTGNASASEVVKGNDTRLSDARPASDVSAWAKAADKPTYTAAEVGLGNVGNFKAVSTVSGQGLSSAEQAAARANIGLENAPNYKAVSTEANQGLTDTEKANARNNIALGSSATLNVAATGNAGSSEVVKGDDTRLTDARNAADVYAWAKESSKPTYTASEVGLGNVGNFKAVSTESNQGLTATEKSNARDNIGAGTSNFDGQYSSLTGAPTLGTAAAMNVAVSGDAATGEVVKGDDTRLTDARNAADVYSWAKAETKPTYTASEVGLGNVGNFKAVSTVASQGLTDTEKGNARDNIGLGTAAVKSVPASGNAGSSEVVLGNDTRLSDSRPASDVSAWAKEATKPTYTASEVGAIPATDKGANNGVATLDSAGKIPSSQLPGSVDEIIEGYLYDGKFYEDSAHTTEIPGEASKIYVDLSTNKTYRYSGSAFVEISESLALGETSSTAYRGDYGAAAYAHSQVTTGNPHNVTKSDVGLGNVGNFKAVSTEASQGLTSTEQENARTNIGAGTSSFSGSYTDLTDKPTLGSAAALDVATSGDASTTEVVKGDDSRLTDARNAADVYDWAKAATKPTYTASEVGLGNVGNFKAVSTVANQGLTDAEKQAARDNIGAGSSSFSGSYNDLTDKPTLGTAAALNVAASGDASSSEVVKGNDTRLSDARNAADVYSWAKAETKPTYTASEVGLGNVGNFKAVSTEANQGLSATEQSNARANIALDNVGNFKAVSTVASQGLTSTEQDNARDNIGLGSAAVLNVAASGNASTTEVVKGDDTRLTDARNAADVYAWAKESTKPTYTAAEVGAIPSTDKGANGGVATLDSTGKIPSSQLPGSVDEIIEGYYYDGKFYEEDTHTTEIVGETSKIYVDLVSNKTYRYSGSAFVEISASLALGETSSTAYRGDYGAAAYAHSLVVSGNPHNVTASDVGLGNVGNFKAVSTEANQGLTSTEQANARANIGAGTSSFDGQYSSLTGTPTLGSASALDVASSGDASTTQVVKGDDSRLSDARNAADVYSWAKAETKPTYTASEVGLGNVGNFKAVSTEANQGLTSTEQENARTNIGAGTSSLVIGNTSTTAAAGDHTHTASMAASAATADITLSAASTYEITAGGDTVVFTTPTDSDTHRPIQVDGTQVLGDNTTALNLVGGNNITLTASGGSVTIDAAGAGHTIKDASGTSMTQRDALEFDGYLITTDDSTNGKTVVSDAPTEVTWAQWEQMTDQQKAGKKWLISGAPGDLGETAIFVLANTTLTFTNLTATVSDARITGSTYPLVYWSSTSYDTAVSCKITSNTSTGAITFTAETAPSTSLTCDIVFIGAANGIKPKAQYTVTAPTSGYTDGTVTIWGETKSAKIITLTADSAGNPLSDFTADMPGDYPVNMTGSMTDFKKLYATEIGAGTVTLYFSSVPSAAFNILIREA